MTARRASDEGAGLLSACQPAAERSPPPAGRAPTRRSPSIGDQEREQRRDSPVDHPAPAGDAQRDVERLALTDDRVIHEESQRGGALADAVRRGRQRDVERRQDRDAPDGGPLGGRRTIHTIIALAVCAQLEPPNSRASSAVATALRLQLHPMDPREEIPGHDGWGMTEGRLGGVNWPNGGQPGGAKEPVYHGRRGQMFHHPDCSRELEDVERREPCSQLGRLAQSLFLPLREVPSHPGTAPWEGRRR